MSDGVMSSDNFNTAACESTGGVRQDQHNSPGGEARNSPGGVDSMAHDAPLVELVARLGGGRSLRERVIALRWKRRKRPPAGQAGSAAAECSGAVRADKPDPLGGECGDHPPVNQATERAKACQGEIRTERSSEADEPRQTSSGDKGQLGSLEGDGDNNATQPNGPDGEIPVEAARRVDASVGSSLVAESNAGPASLSGGDSNNNQQRK